LSYFSSQENGNHLESTQKSLSLSDSNQTQRKAINNKQYQGCPLNVLTVPVRLDETDQCQLQAMSMMPSKIKIICWCCQLGQCVLVATLTSIKNLLLFSFRSQLTQRYLQVLCNKEESFGKIQDVCVTVLPSKFEGRVLNFSPPAAQKVVWIGREGDSGAGLTLQHHSLDSYGGHEMVQQHLTL
jgi:hypothetical protein